MGFVLGRDVFHGIPSVNESLESLYAAVPAVVPDEKETPDFEN